MPRPRINRVKLITQNPSDLNVTTWVPYAWAWTAARAIARETHSVPILYGEYGRAVFRTDGSGYVEWNAKSTKPGERTTFDERTTVLI